MAKETVPNRRYTDEFKAEALRLAESVGINQAAMRLDMPSSSLGNWARQSRQGQHTKAARLSRFEGRGSPAVKRSEWMGLRSVSTATHQDDAVLAALSGQWLSL
jgi:transposase